MEYIPIKYKKEKSSIKDRIEFISTEKRLYSKQYIPSHLRKKDLLNKKLLINKIVIGKDERKVIKNTNFFPISTITKLIITFPSGKKFLGTGTIISNNHLLTVAHNLYKDSEGGWAININIYPGKSSRKMPYGYTKMNNMYIPIGYIQSQHLEYDFGVVEFIKSYVNLTGKIGLLLEYNGLKNIDIRIIGYPLNRKNGRFIFFSEGKIFDSNNLVYEIDTSSGQSGAGIFYSYLNYIFLVGIHSRRRIDGKENLGLGFNKEIFKFIHNIIN